MANFVPFILEHPVYCCSCMTRFTSSTHTAHR